MLSQENRDKLILTGLYEAEPNKKIHSWYSEPYWCFNWTFKVQYNENKDKYYMVDTYYGDKYFELIDEYFELFTLIFDFNYVEKHNGNNIWDYDEDDIYHVAIDSGGMYCGGKYFIKKGATKNKEKVLRRLKEEIDSAKDRVKDLERNYDDALNDRISLRYV